MYALAKTRLASTTSSVKFNNIQQSYKDLYIVINSRSNWDNGNAFTGIYWYINNQYYQVADRLTYYGNGTSTASVRATASGNYLIAYPNQDNATTSNIFGGVTIYIPGYNKTFHKPIIVHGITENASQTAHLAFSSILYKNSSPITSIEFAPWDGSFAAGTNISLYGIK